MTAVEVLLEHRYRTVLAESGVSSEEIESRVWETRMDFMGRLDLYCQAIGKRVPGPLVHWIPEIIGVRLREELANTRALRHQIVHQGQRLDHTIDGLMLRAVETSTWLFDWLGGVDLSKRQFPHYTFYNTWKPVISFPFDLRPDGVFVLPRPPLTEVAGAEDEDSDDGPVWIHSLDPGELHPRFMRKALGGGDIKPDAELFAKLALARLSAYDVEDSPPIRDSPLPLLDRYRVRRDEGLTIVSLIDTDGILDIFAVERIAAMLSERASEGLAYTSALLIVNDQNGTPFDQRRADTISHECLSVAERAGLAIVKSEDLARLALGVRAYGWPSDQTYRELLRPGRQGKVPPGALLVGVVRHYFSGPNAASVELTGAAKISVGDTLSFRLRRKFHQQTITSMQQERVAVMEAQHGRVGIQMTLTRRDLPIGSEVYLMTPANPALNEAEVIPELGATGTAASDAASTNGAGQDVGSKGAGA